MASSELGVEFRNPVAVDLFISYAWTSWTHREYVRLLASHMHLIGYNVLIDENVDYGSSLSGFMRKIADAKHVLMVADENYVHRADNLPESGVGIENTWIEGIYQDRPADWLSAVFVRNPRCLLPIWISGGNPKGFDFNSSPDDNNFPGSAQIEDLWRWIEGLPADKSKANPLSVIRQRASRLERIETLRDPGHWANPALSGEVNFQYRDQQQETYKIGHGEFEFAVSVSAHTRNRVYLYADHVKAVGLIPSIEYERSALAKFLSPGRSITPRIGQSVVLLNKYGILCTLRIEDVQHEINNGSYVPPYVKFTYVIHNEI